MSNKSSIEWLMIHLYEQGLLKGDGNKMDDLFEQAKEMHKQEIIAAKDDNYVYGEEYKKFGLGTLGEQYYKETFGE